MSHAESGQLDPPARPGLLPGFRRFFRFARRPIRLSLSREGWAYLLLLLLIFGGAMIREVNLRLAMAAMMVGPLWLSRRLVTRTLTGLKLERKTPHGICAGDLLVVNVKLSNPRKHLGCWTVAVEERLQREGDPNGNGTIRSSVFFSYVPAGQSRSRIYRGRIPRRGRYRLGPMEMSTRFPFGFIRADATLGETDSLVVFPRLGRLRRGWAARHHDEFEGTSHRERRPSRVTGEFFGVREWQSGDSRRWIHWRSSAKHGELVVRQFEQHRNRDLAILLDLWQPETADTNHLENVELAVSFVATVVASACRKGGSNLLVGATGREPSCTGGPASAALLQTVMENLAVAEASHEDGLPDLLDHALERVDRGTEVIVIGTRPNDLSDGDRFAHLRETAAVRAIAGRIRVFDTAEETLSEYFEPI